MSCGPPCPPCAPRSPYVCPPECPPAPPPPPCRPKPVMRGLHRALVKRNLATAIGLSFLGGFSYYYFVGLARREKYRDFYAKAELEEWATTMARLGVFQAVPRDGPF